MKLSDYLAAREMKASAFAAILEVEPSTVTRLLRGERSPSLSLIQRIREATEGKVSFDDFLPARDEAAA